MQLVDWQVAAATAERLAPPGPRLPLDEAVATVEELRRLADAAAGHVADVTGLPAATGPSRVAVVDRPGWIRANIEGFRTVVDPLLEGVLADRRVGMSPLVSAVGSKATGVEVGALVAYLSTRVLGQFELFGPVVDADSGGRLLLVAPNIVATERLMAVAPHDFRLWVCLHEVTHRTQFDAAPWLRAHVQELLHTYLSASELDPAAVVRRLREAVGSLADAVRGRSDLSLLEIVQTPEQRKVLDRVTGLMSLLEGHADVVMDGVGPKVVPSVATIRDRFEQRRRSGGRLERTLRRLFGIEMKMRQYAEGARFVRAVVDAVEMDGFNRVWSGPHWLPGADEIRDPDRWLARVATDPPAVSA